MDYDKTTIATTYDAARGYRPEVLRQWLDVVAAHALSDLALIVDLGCGTGRFSQPLADRFQVKVIGIDPSQCMLGIAPQPTWANPVEHKSRPIVSVSYG
jgi:ubiquinone/menaquinone biosynthesis C-methylase UbiE